MEKTLGYIFGSLQVSEAAIGGLIKDLKKQKHFNKKVVGVLALLGVWSYSVAAANLANKQKIEELTKEVEELKKSKGE